MKLTLKTLALLFLAALLLTATSALAETISGSIEFAQRVKTSLPVSGTVEMLDARPGQSIKKGQILLRLNKLPFESTVIQARSHLQIKNADYIDAKRDLDHAKELFDRAVLSIVELEKANLNEKRADAEQKSAQAQLDKEKFWLEKSSIVAPFDGWVLGVNVKAGEIVNNALSTQAMLSLAEANWYNAIFTLGLTSVKLLKQAKSIKVKVDGKRYAGELVAVGLEPVNASTGSKARYKIHIKFNSNGRLLRSGQSASINLPN